MRPKQSDVKLMISIVNPEDSTALTAAINGVTRCMHFAFIGHGTARSHLIDYLGLGSPEKTVVLSIIPSALEKLLLSTVSNKIKLYMVGKGISFTTPITALSSLIANAITTGVTRDKGANMKNDNKYELIVASYALDFSDRVIEAARQAGASGGTVVHARSLASTGVEQFVGITLQKDTEILFIIAKQDVSRDIMRAIQDSAGLKTKGTGTVISLPVDCLAGIGTTSEQADIIKD